MLAAYALYNFIHWFDADDAEIHISSRGFTDNALRPVSHFQQTGNVTRAEGIEVTELHDSIAQAMWDNYQAYIQRGS